MWPAVVAVRNLALVGQSLYTRIEICDIHNGTFVSDSAMANVLFYDAQERLPVRVWRWNVDLHKSGSDVRGEVLLAHVGSRVHTGEDPEIWVARDRFQGPLFGERD